ncbi:hypothetical protein QQF64_018287 [Cirrhinus molitorella]|uniref:Uncharacterized protein n=1 Tax=Cirrhinus molitorella TaxID=172907 RepID=A0ABR3LC59_9TELE
MGPISDKKMTSAPASSVSVGSPEEFTYSSAFSKWFTYKCWTVPISLKVEKIKFVRENMNDPEPCGIKQEDIEQQIDLKEENRETEELLEEGKKHQV